MAKGDAGANLIWWGGAIFAGIIFIPKLLSAQTRVASPGQVATAQANKAIQAAGNVGTSWLSQALASLLKGQQQQQQSKPSSGGGFGAAPTASGRALTATAPSASSSSSQQPYIGPYSASAYASGDPENYRAGDYIGPYSASAYESGDPAGYSAGDYIGPYSAEAYGSGDPSSYSDFDFIGPYSVEAYASGDPVSYGDYGDDLSGLIWTEGLIDDTSNSLPFYLWGDYGDYGYGDFGYDFGGYGVGDDRWFDGSGWY